MAFRDSAQSFVASTSITPTMPTIVAGDQLLAMVMQDLPGCTYSGFSGWTKLDTRDISGPDGQCISLFAKISAGSDTLSITSSSVNASSSIVASFSGRNASASPSFSATTPNTSSNSSPISISLSGITAASGDDVVAFTALDVTIDTNTWSLTAVPSGMTRRNDCLPPNNWAIGGMASVDAFGGGATGSLAFTATATGGSAGWAGYVVTLPASSGGAGALATAATGTATTTAALSTQIKLAATGAGAATATAALTTQIKLSSALTAVAACVANFSTGPFLTAGPTISNITGDGFDVGATPFQSGTARLIVTPAYASQPSGATFAASTETAAITAATPFTIHHTGQ